MYAASLNLDIFFRKVFSDENIAKDYLECFLGVIIEEIKLLRVKHKLTNSATIVEFDFRCKINGQYIIIEMQQSYKPDVVKRFYIYHALNSGLQLEGLPKKVSVNQQTGEETETLSYAGVLPVYTLIWMVDDNLGFDVETITFALSPEQTVDFIKNNDLWASKDVEKICAVREEILTLLQNNSKDLDFLPQNKLTFAFQKNIVKSKKFQAYKEWFEFAEATRNKKNTKKDFDKFSKNKTLMLVLERIKTDTLNVEELDYLSSWRELDEERGEVAEAKERVAQEREEVAKELQQVTEELQQLAKEKEEVAKDKKEVAKDKKEIAKDKEEIAKDKEEIAKDKEEIAKELHQVKSGQYLKEVRQEVRQEVETQLAKETEEKVVLAHKLGLANALIATIMKLTVEEVNGIIEKNENI